MSAKRKKMNILVAHLSKLLSLQGIDQMMHDSPIFNELEGVRIKSIVVVSDYGGEHEGAKADTYGFLCTLPQMLHIWHDHIKQLRSARGIEARTMAYKKLPLTGTSALTAALPEWLSLANRIAGVLFVVSIDKRLDTIFGEGLNEVVDGMAKHGYDQWASQHLEKALRVVTILAYLVSLITHEGQRFLWITHRDPIADNETKRRALENLLVHARPIYSSDELERIAILVPEEKNSFVEDIVGIPDLACGAVSAGWTALGIDKDDPHKEHATCIYEFLNNGDSNLQKYLIHFPAEELEGQLAVGGQLYSMRINQRGSE